MKRIFVGVLVLSLCFAITGLALAADKTEKKKVVKTVTAPAMSEQQRNTISAKAFEQLSAQVWTIYLTAQGVKKPKVETDVLTFSGETVVSQNLSAKGFGGSNFSLSVQEDGTSVFETVQRAADDSIALWRGTLAGDKLNGILNIRPTQGAATTYSFSTVMPVVSAEPEVVTAQPTETQKKKR